MNEGIGDEPRHLKSREAVVAQDPYPSKKKAYKSIVHSVRVAFGCMIGVRIVILVISMFGFQSVVS